MVKDDALDLPATYNNMGLALKKAGTDTIAMEEAFVAGLAIAPEDLALLVNYGVSHQASEAGSWNWGRVHLYFTVSIFLSFGLYAKPVLTSTVMV